MRAKISMHFNKKFCVFFNRNYKMIILLFAISFHSMVNSMVNSMVHSMELRLSKFPEKSNHAVTGKKILDYCYKRDRDINNKFLP